jgi:enoyl-CoA hydratase/carnithine racemase
VFKYFDTNDELWVAICTGSGRAFSAGFDLKSAAGKIMLLFCYDYYCANAGLAPPEDTTPDLTTGFLLEG